MGLTLKASATDSVGRASGARRSSDWVASRRAPSTEVAGRFFRSDQCVKVVGADQPQPADQCPQQGFLRDIVFDHEAGAIIIDARALDARACAQPRQRRFGKGLSATEGRNMEAHPARNEMPDRQFHREMSL